MDKNPEDYWKTEEYKAWLKLVHDKYSEKSIGYWVFDGQEQKWVFIPPIN